MLISRVKTLVMYQRKPTRRMASYEHPDVRKFLKDWNKLNIKDDVLYRSTSINSLDYNQLVAPAAVQDTILKALHDDQGHKGHDRTAWLVKTRFFWLRKSHDIERKVCQCNRCILQKTHPIPAAELVNITSTAPMDIVCIDYLSLEMSKGGYENVLVITDHFTRYAQASPTRNQTAQTTAKILYDNFIVLMPLLASSTVTRHKNLNPKSFSICAKLVESRRLEQPHITLREMGRSSDSTSLCYGCLELWTTKKK